MPRISQVKMAANEWGMDMIMKDIKRDGRPHTAVGINVGISVRTGVGTAYPHPNQLHHNKIKKGDALQVSGGVRIGGHGGELYRGYQIAPWTDEHVKMWEVQNECIHIQARESKAGVRCWTSPSLSSTTSRARHGEVHLPPSRTR